MAHKKQKAEAAEAENQAADQTPPAGEPSGFITSPQLARRLQCSIGTITNWRQSGKIPWVVTPGRSIRFHWPTVEQALLRLQRGGQ